MFSEPDFQERVRTLFGTGEGLSFGTAFSAELKAGGKWFEVLLRQNGCFGTPADLELAKLAWALKRIRNTVPDDREGRAADWVKELDFCITVCVIEAGEERVGELTAILDGQETV